MRKTIAGVGLALVSSLVLGGAVLAQPSGGPDAKGNAPLKHAHTVNDGGAKRGASSFTEAQARRHIEHAGFSGVTHLVQGDDGVWRGQAARGGANMNVAMDFKGNVSTQGAAAALSQNASTTTTTATSRTTTANASPLTETAVGATALRESRRHARRHHRRWHGHLRRHRPHAACAHPGPNGVACSGVDRNRNGVSDKEDRAIRQGAKP